MPDLPVVWHCDELHRNRQCRFASTEGISPAPATAPEPSLCPTQICPSSRTSLLPSSGRAGAASRRCSSSSPGLFKATRGSVRVGGQEVKKPLKTIGMAFQNSTLLPWRNVRDNVLLPFEIVEPYRSQPKSEMPRKREIADELLASVGWRISAIACRGSCPAACSSAHNYAAR